MTDTDNLPDHRPLTECGVDGQRLLSVYNFIAEHEDQHDQSTWGGLDANQLIRAQEEGDIDFEIRDTSFEGNVAVAVIDNKVKEIDCGSTGCFAGWTVMLAGGKPVINLLALSDEHQVDFHQVVMPDEEGVRNVAVAAADLLFGVNGGEVRYLAEELFNGDNSPAFLREFVLRVLNGANYHDLQAWIQDADDYEWDYADHPDYEPITFDEGLGVYV